jgi:hypothetical protein
LEIFFKQHENKWIAVQQVLFLLAAAITSSKVPRSVWPTFQMILSGLILSWVVVECTLNTCQEVLPRSKVF